MVWTRWLFPAVMFGFIFFSNLHWFCFVFAVCRFCFGLCLSLCLSLSVSLEPMLRLPHLTSFPPLCGVCLFLFFPLFFPIQSSLPKSFKRKISVVCKSSPKSLIQVRNTIKIRVDREVDSHSPSVAFLRRPLPSHHLHPANLHLLGVGSVSF